MHELPAQPGLEGVIEGRIGLPRGGQDPGYAPKLIVL